MAAFGVKVEVEIKEDFDLWDINLEPFEVFMACATQWKRGVSGAVLCLDYTALAAVMSMMDIKDKKMVFEDVPAMERICLGEFSGG